MKTSIRHSFILLTVMALFATTSAKAADVWVTDLDAAKAQAAAEKKDLVILFTGSTWCPYCIKLEQKVFSTADFQNEAPKDFVLVKLDFPKDLKKATVESVKLAQQYGVQGFPTVVLADDAGKAYAQAEYFHGVNGKVYVGHLKAMKDDAAAARQKFAEGLAATDAMVQAQKYHEGIELMTDIGAPLTSFRDQVKAIAIADTASTLKYGGQASYRAVYVSIVSQEVANLARAKEITKAHATVDLLLSEIKLDAEEKQIVLFTLKGRLYEIEGNAAKAIETYQAALDLAPSSQLAPQIKAYIEEIKKTQSDIIDVN